MYMFDKKKNHNHNLNLLMKSPWPTFFLFSNPSLNPSPKPFFQEHLDLGLLGLLGLNELVIEIMVLSHDLN